MILRADPMVRTRRSSGPRDPHRCGVPCRHRDAHCLPCTPSRLAIDVCATDSPPQVDALTHLHSRSVYAATKGANGNPAMGSSGPKCVLPQSGGDGG